MSSSSAFSFIATSSSGAIALPSTRCCQPAASVRLESTVTKPLSSSMTASRVLCCEVKTVAIVCSGKDRRPCAGLADRAGRGEYQHQDPQRDPVDDEDLEAVRTEI